MKIREVFKKVEAYNEVAEMIGAEKAHVWFADVITAGVLEGDAFTSYDEFRKYIRREYFEDVVEFVLKTGDFNLNNFTTFVNKFGREMRFEVYIEK